MQHGSNRSLPLKLLTGLPVLILLLAVILFGTAEKFHNTLLNTGEEHWPGYREYRFDPEEPTCDLESLDQRILEAEEREAKPESGGEGGDDLFDDLFDEEDLEDSDGGGEGAEEDDLLEGLEPAGQDAEEDDLLEGLEPAGEDAEEDDLLEGLEPADEAAAEEEATDDAATNGEITEEEKADAVDDLFGEEEPTEAAEDVEPTEEEKADAVDDLFDEDEPAEATETADAGEGSTEDAESADQTGAATDEEAQSDGDVVDELFGEEEAGASVEALQAARDLCVQSHEKYERVTTTLEEDSNLRTYRWFETSVASFIEYGVDHIRHFLVLLILFCAFTATLLRGHISLRPIRSVLDDRVSQVSQLVANGFLALSFRELNQINLESGVEVAGEAIPVIWMWGFAVLAAINVLHLIRPLKDPQESTGFAKATLTVPLYVVMALVGALYFGFVEEHLSGAAIFLGLLTEHALLYVHVGLYVWAGMLLKNTEISRHAFNVIRPWKLPPEILAWVVVTAAAIPTAYSGASGIFVIAAGAIIYKELTEAGARKQLAAAATAMSGSLGVVLSPCLLVVIVAALNKEVTTDQLFSKGFWVFFLSSTLFLIGCLLVRKNKLTMETPGKALPRSMKAALPLLPYLIIGVIVVLGFDIGLNTGFDEHSAPVVLPVLLIAILIYDRVVAKAEFKKDKEDKEEKEEKEDKEDKEDKAGDRPLGFFGAAMDGTSEASLHIGALLVLMGLSVVLGGVVERAELMMLLPQEFGSPFTAMALLVVMLVIIGMSMDPYGAVILVSSSIAGVAYANGIDPVHFWLVVLTAFELGYLTPPVALNHLLTRQVVDEDGDYRDDLPEDASFWARHERILLPVTVMGIALLLVAFVPLFW